MLKKSKSSYSLHEAIEWVQNLVNVENDTEDTLQQKIIEFYGLIEQKTMQNINLKKQNDELQVQISAYSDVVNRVKKNPLSCEREEIVELQKKFRRMEKENRELDRRLRELQSQLSPRLQPTNRQLQSKNTFLRKDSTREKKMKNYASIESLWSSNRTNDNISEKYIEETKKTKKKI